MAARHVCFVSAAAGDIYSEGFFVLLDAFDRCVHIRRITPQASLKPQAAYLSDDQLLKLYTAELTSGPINAAFVKTARRMESNASLFVIGAVARLPSIRVYRISINEYSYRPTVLSTRQYYSTDDAT